MEDIDLWSIIQSNIQEGVILTHPNGIIREFSPIAQKICGITSFEAIGNSIEEILPLYHIHTRKKVTDYILKAREQPDNFRLPSDLIVINRLGQELNVAIHISPIFATNQKLAGILIFLQDMTEIQRIKKQLQTGLRMTSLAKLSSGIAHDFNNILTTILGNISLVRLDVDPDSEISELLADAENGIEQARLMTRQLLTFARERPTTNEILAIKDLIQEAVKFTLAGSNVVCSFDIIDDLADIQGDRTQITQVFHNVVLNAIQAMPIGGEIKIKARNTEVTDENSQYLLAGKYIEIKIVDQGIGIDNDLLPHLFDPFYESSLENAGKGLSVAHEIISRHKGSINLESEAGIGTTVSILLPAFVLGKETIKLENTIPRSDRGLCRILIMDDEDIILKVMSKMLNQLGYKPFTAKTGEDAITLFSAALDEKKPFDAVILDLTVKGGMGGAETINHLVNLDPGVIAIASSGYADDIVMQKFRDYGFANRLIKPYKFKDVETVFNSLFFPE